MLEDTYKGESELLDIVIGELIKDVIHELESLLIELDLKGLMENGIKFVCLLDSFKGERVRKELRGIYCKDIGDKLLISNDGSLLEAVYRELIEEKQG